ncbi:MAG: hypothetical protein LBB38_00120 [Puniceicoccales bacterium]|jgi:hypothetical protein|nr:hypothetical protein [Puniceicoccales bacterium]
MNVDNIKAPWFALFFGAGEFVVTAANKIGDIDGKKLDDIYGNQDIGKVLETLHMRSYGVPLFIAISLLTGFLGAIVILVAWQIDLRRHEKLVAEWNPSNGAIVGSSFLNGLTLWMLSTAGMRCGASA